MSYYEFLVTVHVLAAITWVGSEIFGHFLAIQAKRRGPQFTAAFAADTARWGNMVLIAASVLLLITGTLAVQEGPWEFSQAWISIGMTVWLIGLVLGAGFFGPQLNKINAYVKEDGGVMTERSEVIWAKVRMAANIQLVLLLIVVISMVLKPGV